MVENRAGTTVEQTMSRQKQQSASPIQRAALGALAFYQRSISPAFGRRCRYLPTCSEYARTAIERFGVRKGALMSARRLLRCQPFGASGFDPPPAAAREVEPC